jgi:hypothetical protein
MDPNVALHEPLVIEVSMKVKRTRALSNLILCLFALFLLNFLLALYLSFINAYFVMSDRIRSRVFMILRPTAAYLSGVVVQIYSFFGSQALSIFGLGLILALVVLNRTGRVTIKRLFMSFSGALLILMAPFVSAIFCEVYLVMCSGPSELRSKMLRILGYEFIGFYVLVTLSGVYGVVPYYKKLHDEGREVPWFFSAIVFRITRIMTTARHLPMNIFQTCYASHILHGDVTIILDLITSGKLSARNIRHISIAISGVIMASIIVSIVASSRPSFTELGSIFSRDMFIYTVNICLVLLALITSSIIGSLVVLTTRCSAEYTPIVYKSTTLIVLTAMMCACIYFKVTMAYFADLYTEVTTSRTQPPPAVKAVALLADTGCGSQSTDRCGIALLEDATVHNESWGLTGSATITGTSRENASYQLLKDSECGEMFLSTCEMGDSSAKSFDHSERASERAWYA